MSVRSSLPVHRHAGLIAASTLRRVIAADSGGFTVIQTFISQIVVIVLNVSTGLLTARLLGAEGRGIFAAVTLWPQFLSGLCFVGIPAAIVYHVSRAQPASGSILTGGVIIAGLLSVSMVAVASLLLPIAMHGYDAATLALARWCVVATIPYVYLTLLRQMLVARGRLGAFNLSTVLVPMLYLFALLVCWLSVGLTVVDSASTLIAAVVVVVLWLGWYVWRVCPPATDQISVWLLALTKYGLRGAAADGLLNLSGYVDRLVLMSTVPARALGLYAIAYSLSRLVMILQTVANSVLFPRMAGGSAGDAKQLHDHAFRVMLYVLVGAVICAFLLGEPLLRLMYGPAFIEAAPVFDILVIEAALTCIGQLLALLFCSLGDPGYTSVVQTVGFLAVGTGLFVLVPAWGIIGAASAMAIGAAVRGVLLLGGLSIRLKLSLPRLVPRQTDLVYFRQKFLG